MAYIKPNSPLRFNKSNNYFYPITTADQIVVDDKKLTDYISLSNQEIHTVLSANNWREADGQFIQNIIINNLTEDYNVDVKIAYTDNLENDLLINKSANYIKYAMQNYNKITFYCLNKKPNIDIPIELEVYV